MTKQQQQQPPRLGFVGAGAMSRAMMQGVLASKGRPEAQQVGFWDPDASCRAMASKLGAVERESNAMVARNADVVVVCTKPQYVVKACEEMGKECVGKLVVSIAAGVPCAALEAALARSGGDEKPRVVRVMPNTPATLQAMAAGVCRGAHATQQDVDAVLRVLAPLGLAVQVANEDLMHAVTGVSGSGPAYVFVMIEALADGGVRNGLPRDVALKLAAQTVRGAAEMVLATGSHPGLLKDQVASPGGTTIAALAALEARATRSAFIEAVTAASNRSRELSKM